MEPVGLGLSVLALYIECIKAYKIFSTASCLSSDLRILRTKFQIEETRLTQWGTYWGYRSSPEECALDASIDNAGQNVAVTVRLTLQQIATLLKEYSSLTAKYDGVQRGGGLVYRGMTWALKDKATLETTVQNLTDFNNALHQLLPKKSELSLSQAVACALTQENDKDDLDSIIAAAASLHHVDVAKLARFKRAYQLLALEEEEHDSRPPALLSSLQLDEGRIQLSTRHATKERTLANLDGDTRVIVEWKSYHPSMLSGSLTARQTLRNRVTHLAELMSSNTQRPDGFNVLTCVGYFDQASSEHFGFAYDFPRDVVRHMPFTLDELFTSSSAPALGTRFKLALSLARTLNLLHSSGWLHKSIRSNNIVIFQAGNNNEPEYEKPYLLGFGFSRPDGYHEETFLEQSAVASTNQLYRHPEVQGQCARRYTASDDNYSLGLVLLEVALWMSLPKIEGRKQTTSEHVPLNRDKIKATVSSLPKRVGTIYKEVVETCLNLDQGRFVLPKEVTPPTAKWEAERLRSQNMFYWDVVKRLEECRA
ncbi:uncharacterized protein F5Z01DRAFT_74472 [Emericellopsis atlantica]|uniref:Protein kinase domain-containing protein n=1 Tax=Emericellopsis atlantica TaxID=2614577 RepID=A0A9P7ZP17_9HYPO|nr:uncharacterized protein F5Z01DRAFT_74472 [Emericellopsis atlantica]KAG9255095.1 hypothetical protein F5Z01DRAFT_74472 [Emericellopsis atlantica]